jgi:hypothetical protein
MMNPLYLFCTFRLYWAGAGLPAAPAALPTHVETVPQLQVSDLGSGLASR